MDDERDKRDDQESNQEGTNLGVDSVQLFLREDSQEIPSKLQTVKDRSSLVRALVDEFLLETVQEFERELVFCGQSFFTDDGLH